MWALRVKAFLSTNDHARVNRRNLVDGTEVDPVAPDPDDVEDDSRRWVKSEQVALGLMIGTTSGLHFEFCHTFERGPAWRLCRAIGDSHILRDSSSLRYDAWMSLFAVRKTQSRSTRPTSMAPSNPEKQRWYTYT